MPGINVMNKEVGDCYFSEDIALHTSNILLYDTLYFDVCHYSNYISIKASLDFSNQKTQNSNEN